MVCKTGWDDSARRILGRFDSEEEFVPFVVFAGTGGAAAAKGLVKQLCASEIRSVSIQRQLGSGPLLDPPTCQVSSLMTPLC